MSSKQATPRFVFIDALRGIACLAVLFHHLLHNTVLEGTLRRILPAVVQSVCHYGARGVQIFFVISGFVIAYSLRDFVASIRNVSSFVLRRQIRLDPAYWVTILFALLLTVIENRIPSLQHKPVAGPLAVTANLFYLQNIIGTAQVLGVAWTLCIEIQFYLLFSVLIVVAGKVFRQRRARTVLALMTGLLGLWSLSRTTWSISSPWFVPFWCYFAGGALCYWAVAGRIRYAWVMSYALVMLLATMHGGGDAMAFGLTTIVAIATIGKMKGLTRWGGGSVLQYFGRISYSLYLVHLTVSSIVMRTGYKLTRTNAYASLGWMALAGMASIVTAHLLYRFVERPTMRFSSALKSRSERASDRDASESAQHGETRGAFTTRSPALA